MGKKATGKASVSANNEAEKPSNSASSSDDICISCQSVVHDADNCIQCEVCEGWFHIGCQGIPMEVYPFLRIEGLHWYCRGCNSKFSELLKSVVKLQESQTTMQNQIEQTKLDIASLSNKLIENRNEIMNHVNQELNSLTGKCTALENKITDMKVGEGGGRHEIQTDVSGGITLNRSDIIEQIEIDKRRNNIIIMGIEEHENVLEVSKKVVGKLLEKENIGVDTLRSVERVGTIRADKTRPVRLVLGDFKTKFEVLKGGPKLKGTELKKYFVSPDLTAKQQIQDKFLRDKLKAMREGGHTDIKISKGKIVRKNLSGEETLFPPQTTQ